MIFFRADSNETIASGHIMRCIAIAKSFKKHNQNVMFLIADNKSVSLLNENDMDFMVLDSNWEDLSIEIESVKRILCSEPNSILIIDTYSVTKEYVNILSEYARICYLGSKHEELGRLSALINYSSTIDYTFYRKSYDEKDCKLMLGVEYAPLREEFQNLTLKLEDNVGSILISTGNSDPIDIVSKILDALTKDKDLEKITFRVVLGRFYANKEALRKKYEKYENIIFYENVTKMSELMKESDLAISANGTTVYELAAVGLPMITFSMVQEQSASGKAFGDLGISDYCGNAFEDVDKCIDEIINKTNQLVCNNEKRHHRAEIAKKIIDGNGCEKIVSELLKIV